VVFGWNFEKRGEGSGVCLNPVSYPLGDLTAVSRVIHTAFKKAPALCHQL
jgi:hypothetical protein